MGKYVRVVEFKTEFEGEQVRLTMNPLNREAYMRLTRPMIDITSEKYGAAQPRILEQERTKLAMEDRALVRGGGVNRCGRSGAVQGRHHRQDVLHGSTRRRV